MAILQARILGVCCHAPSSKRSLLTQGSNPCLQCPLHCKQIIYPLSHLESQGSLWIRLIVLLYKILNTKKKKKIKFVFMKLTKLSLRVFHSLHLCLFSASIFLICASLFSLDQVSRQLIDLILFSKNYI